MATTEEQDRVFQAAAFEFEKARPGFLELVAKARIRAADGGIDLPLSVRDEIVRLGKDGPSTLYAILTDPHESAALHIARGERPSSARAADHVRRVHSRTVRNQTFQVAGELQGEEREVSEYLEKRRARKRRR